MKPRSDGSVLTPACVTCSRLARSAPADLGTAPAAAERRSEPRRAKQRARGRAPRLQQRRCCLRGCSYKRWEHESFSSCVPHEIARCRLEPLSRPVNGLKAAHLNHPLHLQPPKSDCTLSQLLSSSLTVVHQINRHLAVSCRDCVEHHVTGIHLFMSQFKPRVQERSVRRAGATSAGAG